MSKIKTKFFCNYVFAGRGRGAGGGHQPNSSSKERFVVSKSVEQELTPERPQLKMRNSILKTTKNESYSKLLKMRNSVLKTIENGNATLYAPSFQKIVNNHDIDELKSLIRK